MGDFECEKKIDTQKIGCLIGALQKIINLQYNEITLTNLISISNFVKYIHIYKMKILSMKSYKIVGNLRASN